MRREIRSRPVLVWLIGFCLALCNPINLWPLVALLLFFWFLDRWSVRIGLIAAFLIGLFFIPNRSPTSFEPYTARAQFEVLTVSSVRKDGVRFLAKTRGVTIQGRSHDFLDVTPGEVYESLGRFENLEPQKEDYLAQQGVKGAFVFFGRNARCIQTAPIWQSLPAGIQRYFIRLTNYMYGKRLGAWVSAFCFNQEGVLDQDEVQALRRSGTYHLISASGLHIGVLALSLQTLLTRLRVKRGWVLPVVGLALLFYTMMTGFHDATVRACVMWMIGFGHYLFRREADPLNAISVAGLGWLIFHPSALFSPSFQLTYIVTAALIMFGGSFEDAGFRARAGQAFRVSVVALLASEPLIAWWFGQLTVVSLATNLLVAFAACALLILGLLSVLVGSINLVIGEWIARELAIPVLGWIQASIEWTSKLDFAMFRVDRIPTLLIVAYYLGWLLVWKPPIRKITKEKRAGLNSE